MSRILRSALSHNIGPWSLPLFVCGHRPKTNELLELLLFLFTFWFIPHLNEMKNYCWLGNRISDLQLLRPSIYQLSYRGLIAFGVNLKYSRRPRTCFTCFRCPSRRAAGRLQWLRWVRIPRSFFGLKMFFNRSAAGLEPFTFDLSDEYHLL